MSDSRRIAVCTRCWGDSRWWKSMGSTRVCRHCDNEGYLPVMNHWRPYEPCKEET